MQPPNIGLSPQQQQQQQPMPNPMGNTRVPSVPNNLSNGQRVPGMFSPNSNTSDSGGGSMSGFTPMSQQSTNNSGRSHGSMWWFSQPWMFHWYLVRNWRQYPLFFPHLCFLPSSTNIPICFSYDWSCALSVRCRRTRGCSFCFTDDLMIIQGLDWIYPLLIRLDVWLRQKIGAGYTFSLDGRSNLDGVLCIIVCYVLLFNSGSDINTPLYSIAIPYIGIK